MENEEVVKFNKVPSIIMIIVSLFVGGAIGAGFAIGSLATGSKVDELVANGSIEEAKKKIKTAKSLLLVTYIWDAFIAIMLTGFIVLAVVAEL